MVEEFQGCSLPKWGKRRNEFLDILGVLLIFADARGFSLIFMDVRGCCRIFADVRGIP